MVSSGLLVLAQPGTNPIRRHLRAHRWTLTGFAAQAPGFSRGRGSGETKSAQDVALVDERYAD
jgi:hypothetical protein